MATTTTLTSLSTPTSQSKELCSFCEAQPYDLICTCGDKFDFVCIQQHVEQISYEFNEQYDQVTKKLTKVDDLKEKGRRSVDAARTLVENWKRKRIQDINDIADKAIHDVQQQDDALSGLSVFQETYKHISAEMHRAAHDNLNNVIKLNQQIQNTIDGGLNASTLIKDDTSLDAAFVSKIDPQALTANAFAGVTSSDATSSSSFTNMNHHESIPTNGFESVTYSPPPRDEIPRDEIPRDEILRDEIPRDEIPREAPKPSEPTLDLTNSTSANEVTYEGTNHDGPGSDEFDAGKTRHIRRTNPVVIPVNNDRFSAAVCCHNNQLLYNDFDKTHQEYRLTFVSNLTNPKNTQLIDWNQRGTAAVNGNDDEWIQDIVYSEKLSKFLLLNRARLRTYNENTNELDDFHIFNERTMKRLACSNAFIYLTSSRGSGPYNGDEIILMNYDKEEKLSKTFRDIIPSRLNRGAGPLVGEISDIAVGANEQVGIGYRLERRHEVGVCLFNVTNDGREWSCVKQLLLNECWHSDLSYTPRLDWSEKLKIFILIEYITGHLIMIDREGQVEGECRFMQVENRQESPINLTISNNDWFAVRYSSSIAIHKLVS